MIPVIFHRLAKLITVSILKDWGIDSSLSLYCAFKVLWFGKNPLSHVPLYLALSTSSFS